ncbi:MAG TPA: cistern family PEP-CTERM protein [Chthonomonadaceae bacterium]|nr:cistern family PEP-CTERM protein [Chthonomonadaceae bacterium]
MFSRYRVCAALLCLAALASAQSAEAINIGSLSVSTPLGNPAIYQTLPTVTLNSGDVGQSFMANWLLPTTASGISTDLKATGTFTVTSFNSSDLRLNVTLTNTTSAAFQAALMSLGINATPNAVVSIAVPGAIFDGASTGNGPNQTFPGGFKNIDVGAYAANNLNGGNINQGLQSGGQTDTFTLDLAGNFGLTPLVTLDTFAVKYQTQAGSFELPAGSLSVVTPPITTENNPPPTSDVPEPGALAFLVGIGAGSFAYTCRRLRRR